MSGIAANERLQRIRPALVGYLMSSGALASAAFSQLVTFAILARALGPIEFGLFVQISAVTAIAVQLCALGASDCLLRRVSREPGSYAALLGHNLCLIAVTGAMLVSGGALALSAWFRIGSGPSVGTGTLVLLLFGNVVLVRVILLAETAFLGLGRFHQANRAVVGFALARMAVAALACLVFRVSTLADWALWQCAGNLLYALLGAVWLRPLGRPRLAILREELMPGLLFASQFAMRAIRANVDLLVIGLFAPLTTIGSYGVARRIMDASYLAIDALNRLLYPRLARASRDGLHHALPLTKQALAAALALGVATCLALFLLAPELPALFGRQYQDLSFFVRCLSGMIVLVGAWAVAVDLLGACGRQDIRAWILNGANLLGSVLIAGATWLAAPIGTFIALYLVEGAIAGIAWIVLLRLVRRSRAQAEASRVL
uniref:Lipopolysaccharide biosynthesis protein n=1 Tax=Bosea sp. NBC_00436 TaxID=2969620 RepID=A0A9E7ZYC6_9HYPH